ncbi:MAG: hypothetical protein HQ556_13565 [Candidatus Marinimicrobia bacterium]|nr:hypothetical protein [Candidatus Neomarinimicrobiota bacterium]
MDPIQKAVYDTIHKGKRSVIDLADLYGLTENSVYKMGLEDSQFVKALRRVGSLIQIQGKSDILKVLNSRAGYLSVKIPRVPINKEDENVVVADYQRLANETVDALMQFFTDPGLKQHNHLVGQLTSITEMSMGIKKRVEMGNQLELLERA